MNKVYCKAGNFELTKEEAEKIYFENKYVVTSTAIYQPRFSQAQNQIYFTKIANVKNIAKRGRFFKLTAEQINHILGYEYLIES